MLNINFLFSSVSDPDPFHCRLPDLDSALSKTSQKSLKKITYYKNLIWGATNKQIFLCSVLFVESSDVIAAMEALQPPAQEDEDPDLDAHVDDVEDKEQDYNPAISFNVLSPTSEEGEKEANTAAAPTSTDSIQFSTEPAVTLQVSTVCPRWHV